MKELSVKVGRTVIKVGDTYFNGKYNEEMIATERCINSIPGWIQENYEIRKIPINKR